MTIDANGIPVFGPECYTYWTVAAYDLTKYVSVQPGSAAAARTTVLANTKACYSLAVAGIKKANATRPVTTSWVWFTMGYPNNYGCWDMVSGHPSSDSRLGAWWVYGADAAAFRAVGPLDIYSGLPSTIGGGVYGEVGAVCK
jgi:hypothetical protein